MDSTKQRNLPATTGLILGILGAVGAWAMSLGWPVFVRHSGNAAEIYSVAAVGWGLVIALDLGALVLGIMAVRRPIGRALSGAAIALGISGVFSFVVSLIFTTPLLPFVR